MNHRWPEFSKKWHRWPLWSALAITLLVQSGTLLFLGLSHRQQLALSSPQELLVHSQGGSQLPSALWLQLIQDFSPRFCCQEIGQWLASHGLFSSLQLERKEEGRLLQIDYEVRSPRFYLGDWENSAIGQGGVIMAMYPFITPKRLPIVVLGPLAHELAHGKANPWGKELSPELWHAIAATVSVGETVAASWQLLLEQVDLSRLAPSSQSTGELLLTFVSREPTDRDLAARRCYVRLAIYPQTLEKSLERLKQLTPIAQEEWRKSQQSLIVDMRSIDMALISPSAAVAS